MRNTDDELWQEADPEDGDLSRPRRHRTTAWIMFALLFVGPLATFLSVLKIAPLLLVTVILIGGLVIAYFWPARTKK